MSGETYRHRQCPNCDGVAAGGEYAWVSGGSWGTNPARKCPACGFTAPGSRFAIVGDRTAQTDRSTPCATCGGMPTGTYSDGSPKYSGHYHAPIFPVTR